jgi:hypothetical protein
MEDLLKKYSAAYDSDFELPESSIAESTEIDEDSTEGRDKTVTMYTVGECIRQAVKVYFYYW